MVRKNMNAKPIARKWSDVLLTTAFVNTVVKSKIIKQRSFADFWDWRPHLLRRKLAILYDIVSYRVRARGARQFFNAYARTTTGEGWDSFHTILYVRLYTIAKTTAWVAATTNLPLLGGRDRRTPGVSTKKSTAT